MVEVCFACRKWIVTAGRVVAPPYWATLKIILVNFTVKVALQNTKQIEILFSFQQTNGLSTNIVIDNESTTYRQSTYTYGEEREVEIIESPKNEFEVSIIR